jgi:cobalt-precorrin-6B (C15)-methyltransferase
MELRGGPTQDEIMAISLFKLDIREGDVMADIGCGTGKVAVAAAARAGRVIAVDRRPEAIRCAREAIRQAGASNIDLLEGEATDVLRNVGRLDCAFVGGSGSIEEVLEMLAERVGGRIVVNAVLLETMQAAVAAMKRLGIFEEVVHVQVARSRPLAGGMMLTPIHPVFVIVGRRD